jgi:hypothetical protein
MNKLTKYLASAVTAAAIFIGTNAQAQTANPGNTWRFGFGAEGGIPTGTVNNFSNFDLGATVRLQYDTRSNVSYMLTSGFYDVFAKGPASDFGIIPVKAGIKLFATSNIYFSGEAGAGFETNYREDTKLILSPGLGYATAKGLDIGLRYENFSGNSDNFGLVNLRIAYGFKL